MDTKSLHVIGTGRSGTTALFTSILSDFQVGWISAVDGRLPMTVPGLHHLSKLAVGPFRPSNEAMRYYQRIGFTMDFHTSLNRPVRSADLSEAMWSRLRAAYRRIGGANSRPVVIKSTNNIVRLEPLLAIDEMSRFVHIVRDPRAVVSSLLRTDFWSSTKSPRAEPITSSTADSEVAQAALAANHWVYRVREGLRVERENPANFYRFAYEDFVDNPARELSAIADFADLRPRHSQSPYRQLGGAIDSRSREVWRDRLSAEQIDVVNHLTAAVRAELGYLE